MQQVDTKQLIAVSGGHLTGKTKYQAMLLEIKMIENKRAFVVDRRDSRMSRFLGGDFSMVDFIISERNRKVSEQACEGEMLDPMGQQTDVPRPSTKRLN